MRTSILLLLIICSVKLLSVNYKVIRIEYYTPDSEKVTGKLYLPNSPVKKILINVDKRLSEKIDPKSFGDSIMLFNRIRDRFCENGIGYFVYSFPENNDPYAFIEKKWSLFTYANDVELAISILKKKPEFRKTKFGLLGISETGCSTAVVASRNPDIAFNISITSQMMDGYKFPFYAFDGNKKTFELYQMLFKKLIRKNTFIYKEHKYLSNDKTKDSCFLATLDTVQKYIFSLKNFNDSVPIKASKLIKDLWRDNNFDSVQTVTKYGKTTEQIIIIDSIICKFMFSVPQTVVSCQWNPTLYYSKINCPTLIALGDQDKVINFSDNYNATQDIINKHKKKCITLKVFKGLDHGLCEKPIMTKIPVKSKYGIVTSEVYSYCVTDSALNQIVDWVKAIK